MAGQKLEVVKTFPECPWCGSTETCTELAIKFKELRKKGLVKKDDFVSSSKISIPLYNPVVAALTIPFMVQEIDGCGQCGRNRVIRVSVMEVPLGLAKGMMPPPGGLP